jgi:hypothetical protein
LLFSFKKKKNSLAIHNLYGISIISRKEFMKLSEWIKKNKLSYSQAANQFGIININPATNVQRYAKGQRIPHPVVMLKIFKATNKQVQPNDFYEEYWQREEV